MSKKKENDRNGFVYSTDPGFKFEEDRAEKATLPPAQQKLRIRLETKHRGGKTATLIAGFTGSDAELQKLEKNLKAACGTGGSSKDGEIIIQGDAREKVKQWLLKNGYRDTK